MPPAVVALAIAAVVSIGMTVWVARRERPHLRVERVATAGADAAALATLPPALRALMTRLIDAHAALDQAAPRASRLPALATEVVSAAIPLVVEAARLDDHLEHHDLTAVEAEARHNPMRRPLLDDLQRMRERRGVIIEALEDAARGLEQRETLDEAKLEGLAHRLRLL